MDIDGAYDIMTDKDVISRQSRPDYEAAERSVKRQSLKAKSIKATESGLPRFFGRLFC